MIKTGWAEHLHLEDKLSDIFKGSKPKLHEARAFCEATSTVKYFHNCIVHSNAINPTYGGWNGKDWKRVAEMFCIASEVLRENM